MFTRIQVLTVVEVLKKKFTNLSAQDSLNLAMDILEALDKVNEK